MFLHVTLSDALFKAPDTAFFQILKIRYFGFDMGVCLIFCNLRFKFEQVAGIHFQLEYKLRIDAACRRLM